MPRLRLTLALLAGLGAAPAEAQPTAESSPPLAPSPAAGPAAAVSPRPDRVGVTVYRAPGRSAPQPIDRADPDGFAMVTETRTVTIPAGASEIRFEGVAGGIVPQSAIVRGLPEGVLERNYDAQLLSAASLLERSLGRRLLLRRTSRRTGEVRIQEAIVRSGAGGAVVLETAEGFEALRCTGLNETLVYPGVPEGLSARPTLSVRARSSRAFTATITLSYLATGFDWEANYVVNLSRDGTRADIFAWMTLASADETSFVDAEALAVAGRLNRDEDVGGEPPRWGGIELRCWPSGRTHQIPGRRAEREERDGERRDMTSFSPITVVNDEEFTLSGAANVNVMAEQEDLGDLKLYRFPEPVTIASNSQKQVALLRRANVEVALVYRHRLFVGAAGEGGRAPRLLVTRNRTEEGLGLPLPAGTLALYGERGGRPLFLGESFIEDRAVGEPVEIDLEPGSAGVTSEIGLLREGPGWRDLSVAAINDRDSPVRYELEMFLRDGERLETSAQLPRRNGRTLWAVEVPPNGRAELRYRVYRPRDVRPPRRAATRR